MIAHNRIRHRGFTLVEMLVVMAIIAILAAILLPAIRAAVTAGKNTRLAAEIGELQNAAEAYKTKYGDYPPDFSSVTSVNDLLDANNIAGRHLRKAFPRHAETATTLKTVFASGFPDPSEALVFWLAALKNDSRYPLSSTTAAYADPLYTFDTARLVGPSTRGWYSYVPKDGKNVPYVYFDSRTYATVAGYTYNGELVRPYMTKDSETATTLKWANPKTFQIISAGLDGQFGDTTAGKNKLFPWGQATPANASIVPYELGDKDNITNFSEGKMLEDHLP